MTKSLPPGRCRALIDNANQAKHFSKHFFLFLLFIWLSSNICLAQPDIHVAYHSTQGKTHLRGIRRIPSNLYTTKEVPLAEDDPVSNERQFTIRAIAPPFYQQQHMATPPSFPISSVPQASALPESARGQFAPLFGSTLEERKEHIPRQSPTQRLHSKAVPQATLLEIVRQRTAPTATSLPHYQHQSFGKTGNIRQRLTTEDEKQERLKARWRKIGPLIGSAGSRYQRMRLIQQKAWTHPSTLAPTTTYLPPTQKTVRPTHADSTTSQFASKAETVRPTQHRSQPITAAQMAFRATQPTQDPEVSVQTNNIRRQSLRTGSSFAPISPPTDDSLFDKPAKPSRIFGERTQHYPSASRISYPGRRITGPILAPLPEDSHTVQYPQQVQTRIQLPTPDDTGPVIVGDFAPTELPTVEAPAEDYHHRQGMRVEKRFKLVSNRLINRPRLKIRTHDEPRAEGKATNSKSGPISLPELTPFQQQQIGLKTPIGETSDNIPSFPSTDTFAPQLPSHSPQPSGKPSGRPRQLPKVTNWGDEDVESINGHGTPSKEPEDFGTAENLGRGGGTAPSEPAPEETGESGASFGGSVGAPPPGFNEAFGLNGASVPLEESTTTEEPITTRKPRPTTPVNEGPVVIPENSGLRPASPPKEFQGGFGSKKGSQFSSYQSAAIGSSGSGLDNSVGPAPSETKVQKGKKGRRGGKKPQPKQEPELKEEDFFTGDSALVPNNRGPTGDGYNPPVFPGQAIPPTENALSRGGGAAGISPYSAPAMEVTQNTPTTLKPSALLNIWNKADEGFNQMLTNFEQGAPLESAMIDILEVALGSQKLDSQAKLLSHVDRTVGLDNLQRLQRWANTGGALDELKEQLVKIAKNYKPPPETNAITIPPEFEYLFKTSG